MMTNEMMNAKIDELRALEAQIAEINKQVEAIKTQLKGELDSRQVDSVNTEKHNIFYSCYEKAGVDTAKLKAAGLYDEYSKKSTIIQFKITDCKAG